MLKCADKEYSKGDILWQKLKPLVLIAELPSLAMAALGVLMDFIFTIQTKIIVSSAVQVLTGMDVLKHPRKSIVTAAEE